MSNQGYDEPVGELSYATRDMHCAIVSLMEELEREFLFADRPLTRD